MYADSSTKPGQSIVLGKLLILVCENHTKPVSTVCGQNYLPRNFKRGAYSYYRDIRDYQKEHRSEILKKIYELYTYTVYKPYSL